MKRKGGVFIMELKGIAGEKDQDKMEVDAVAEEEEETLEELNEKYEAACRKRYGAGELVFKRRAQ